MQFNKESNGFIITFLIIMVISVSVSLSVVSSVLKPTIDQNKVVDKKTKILKSVTDVNEQEESKLFTAKYVLNTYKEKIDEIAVDYKGNIVKDADPFNIDFKKETRKPEQERVYPVYIYNGDNEKYYIIPLVGMGLWDEISGYLALKGDFNTIKGAAFDHKGETPGLGARIVEYAFRQQFKDKILYGKEGTYNFEILKGEGNPDKTSFQVDGISGATLTSQGTDNMLEKCVKYYRPFFEKQKSS